MSTPQTVLMSLPVWGLDFLGKKKKHMGSQQAKTNAIYIHG